MGNLGRKIAGNTAVQIGGKITSAGLGFLITILLTRYLGHTRYGVYTFAVVFTTLFGTLADWGLSFIAIRESSQNPERQNEILGNTLVIRLALSVVATILSVVAITLLPYDSETRMVTQIAALYLIIASIKTSFQLIFMVKLRMVNWAISEVVANGLTIILIAWIVVSRGSFLEIMGAFLVGNALSAGVAAYLGWKMLPLKLTLINRYTRELLVESVPMGAILVVFTIYNRLDTVILSMISGANAVADYGLAYRIFEVMVLGAAYFANSVLPIISNLAFSDREKMAQIFRKSLVIVGTLGAGAAVVTIIGAPLAVGILGGKEFVGATTVLRILAVALLVSYLNHLIGYTMIALRKQWWSLRIAVVALSVNLILNILLIPYFSYLAAAVITIITEGLIVVLSLRTLNKEFRVLPHQWEIRDIWRDVLKFKK